MYSRNIVSRNTIKNNVLCFRVSDDALAFGIHCRTRKVFLFLVTVDVIYIYTKVSPIHATFTIFVPSEHVYYLLKYVRFFRHLPFVRFGT